MTTKKPRPKTRAKRRRKGYTPESKPGPKPSNGPTSLTAFRLPTSVVAQIDEAASRAGASRTQVVTELLMERFPVAEPEAVSAFD